MATYELQGGEIYASLSLGGGQIFASPSLGGGMIFPGGGGGGGGNLQPSKSVSYTPSETAISANVTPDYGYDAMEKVVVSVDAISSTYVGSGVARNDSTDLTASGATVTAPAGYYESAASKAIPNASMPYIDSASIDSSGKLSVDIEIDNGGYINDGTYGATMSSAFSVQGAQTIYPSASDQSIASGKYLTGAQTIKGVTYSGLDASNIKKDVVVKIGDSADDDRILSVTGTYEGGGGGASFNFTGASDKLFGGMAKALADGNYASGSVTFTTAFPNTWGTLIDTGLETLEGFCAWMQNSTSVQSSQGCSDFVIFKVNTDNTLDYMGTGRPTSANGNVSGPRRTTYSQETAIDGAGMQGTLRINGGIIEYKGRYNRNANYQIFPTNQVIEWIAW